MCQRLFNVGDEIVIDEEGTKGIIYNIVLETDVCIIEVNGKFKHIPLVNLYEFN